MKKLIKSDKKKRLCYKNLEKKNHVLKFLTYANKLKLNLRKRIFFTLYTMKIGSIAIIQNRCVISGRSKGVLRRFKVSRMFLRKNINKLNFPGIYKENN